MSTLYYESSISHHGIKGQKWGIRRFQNKDGTLTPRGQKRYQKEMEKITRDQNVERRRIAMEQAKVREARKTEQARIKLQRDKAGLAEDKQLAKGKQAKTEEPPKQKAISEMTNAEIKAIIDRVDLERKLNAIINPPKQQSALEAWVIKTASEAGTEFIKKAASSYGGDVGKKLGGSFKPGKKDEKKKDDDDD